MFQCKYCCRLFSVRESLRKHESNLHRKAWGASFGPFDSRYIAPDSSVTKCKCGIFLDAMCDENSHIQGDYHKSSNDATMKTELSTCPQIEEHDNGIELIDIALFGNNKDEDDEVDEQELAEVSNYFSHDPFDISEDAGIQPPTPSYLVSMSESTSSEDWMFPFRDDKLSFSEYPLVGCVFLVHWDTSSIESMEEKMKDVHSLVRYRILWITRRDGEVF